jgi:hypothetical protein
VSIVYVSFFTCVSYIRLVCCSEKFTCEPRLLLGLARIHDQLRDPESSIGLYKRVLVLDASNVESIACLGAHFFYSDQVSRPLLLLADR